jgi:hypothetical protein
MSVYGICQDVACLPPNGRDRPNSDIPPLLAALTVESTSCVELKQKTPRKRGLDASKPGIVVELDARHALLDEGTLLHRMNSEVLR